jgi:hypothetical protein
MILRLVAWFQIFPASNIFLIINYVLINEKAGLALTLKNGDYWMVEGLAEFLPG